MAGVDDAEHGQSAQSFAEAWPADVEDIDQLALRGQPVARAEHPCSDQVENAVHYRLRHARFVRVKRIGDNMKFDSALPCQALFLRAVMRPPEARRGRPCPQPSI